MNHSDGKYEKELDVMLSIIGSYIPGWSFLILWDLGRRYGIFSLLTNYGMIFSLIALGLSLMGGIDNSTHKELGTGIIFLIFPLHGLLTYYWIRKYNAKVKIHSNSDF